MEQSSIIIIISLNSIPGRSDRNMFIFSPDKWLRNHFNDGGALRMNLTSAFARRLVIMKGSMLNGNPFQSVAAFPKKNTY